MQRSAEVSFDALGTIPKMLEMIDTADRRGNSFAVGTYTDSGTYAERGNNTSMKRLPRVGVGLAHAEWRVFDAVAKGPNASTGFEASLASGARAFAKAEVASASASAGLVKLKVGLAVDTGVSISLTGVEAKVLGTGSSFGSKMGVSLFGNSIEFN